VVAPLKYFGIDAGLSRANSPQPQPDLGRRLETVVAQHLRRRASSTGARGRAAAAYAGERDRWECDLVTADEAIQVCFELTPANRVREVAGVIEGARLPGRRRPRIVTFDQSDRLREDGVDVDVVPAWQWLSAP
jgi:predicted AAA+ superfamily ATPase